MRSFKSIERPAQVLGMNLQDLGIIVGMFIGSVLLLGFLGMAVKIPRLLYLAVFIILVCMLLLFRYLSKTRPPGFLMGWLSFTFIQPRRISIGLLPTAEDEKTENRRI